MTAVPQSEWRRPVGRPCTSWMATVKNDLALHNLTLEDAIELALDKPLWSGGRLSPGSCISKVFSVGISLNYVAYFMRIRYQVFTTILH